MMTRPRNVVTVTGLLLLVALVVRRRHGLLEAIKDASDVAVAGLLRSTSQFGTELTDERTNEQPAFRYRRLRDLGATEPYGTEMTRSPR